MSFKQKNMATYCIEKIVYYSSARHSITYQKDNSIRVLAEKNPLLHTWIFNFEITFCVFWDASVSWFILVQTWNDQSGQNRNILGEALKFFKKNCKMVNFDEQLFVLILFPNNEQLFSMANYTYSRSIRSIVSSLKNWNVFRPKPSKLSSGESIFFLLGL